VGWSEIDYTATSRLPLQLRGRLSLLSIGRLMRWLVARAKAFAGDNFLEHRDNSMLIPNPIDGFQRVRAQFGSEAGRFPYPAVKTVAEWFRKKERAAGIFNSGSEYRRDCYAAHRALDNGCLRLAGGIFSSRTGALGFSNQLACRFWPFISPPEVYESRTFAYVEAIRQNRH